MDIRQHWMSRSEKKLNALNIRKHIVIILMNFSWRWFCYAIREERNTIFLFFFIGSFTKSFGRYHSLSPIVFILNRSTSNLFISSSPATVIFRRLISTLKQLFVAVFSNCNITLFYNYTKHWPFVHSTIYYTRMSILMYLPWNVIPTLSKQRYLVNIVCGWVVWLTIGWNCDYWLYFLCMRLLI